MTNPDLQQRASQTCSLNSHLLHFLPSFGIELSSLTDLRFRLHYSERVECRYHGHIAAWRTFDLRWRHDETEFAKSGRALKRRIV